MQPTSPHFTPINLTTNYNRDRSQLPAAQAAPTDHGPLTGDRTFSGIPFLLGEDGAENVIWLGASEVAVRLEDTHASWLIFLHAVEDKASNYLDNFADTDVDGHAQPSGSRPA